MKPCAYKTGYPTKKAANRAAKALKHVVRSRGRWSSDLRPYLCKCGKWHLTSNRRYSND